MTETFLRLKYDVIFGLTLVRHLIIWTSIKCQSLKYKELYEIYGFHSDEDLDHDLSAYDIMQFAGGEGRNLISPLHLHSILCRFRYNSTIHIYLITVNNVYITY